MNAATQNPPSPPDQNGPVRVVTIGTLRFEMIPHHLPGVGATVSLTIIDGAGRYPLILPAAGLRKLSQAQQITATEAEHKAHNARLRAERIAGQQKTANNGTPPVERRARP